MRLCEQPSTLSYAYDLDDSLETKVDKIVTRVYGGTGAKFSPEAKRQLRQFQKLGYGNLPVCMAKTQYSFTDNAKKPGAPTGFAVTVRNLRLSAGAGFLVAQTGDILTMPGLPKEPAAERIDVDAHGVITGLF